MKKKQKQKKKNKQKEKRKNPYNQSVVGAFIYREKRKLGIAGAGLLEWELVQFTCFCYWHSFFLCTPERREKKYPQVFQTTKHFLSRYHIITNLPLSSTSTSSHSALSFSRSFYFLLITFRPYYIYNTTNQPPPTLPLEYNCIHNKTYKRQNYFIMNKTIVND